MLMYHTIITRPLTKSQKRCERCYRHMLGEINVFSTATVPEFECPRAVSSKQRYRSGDTEASGPKATDLFKNVYTCRLLVTRYSPE